MPETVVGNESEQALTTDRSGLSTLQVFILEHLYASVQRQEQWLAQPASSFACADDRDPSWAETTKRAHVELASWGVPWSSKTWLWSRAQHAALSRALKRLEARGLILRQNSKTGPKRTMAMEPHARTTDVQLLPAGRKLAERLTKTEA